MLLQADTPNTPTANAPSNYSMSHDCGFPKCPFLWKRFGTLVWQSLDWRREATQHRFQRVWGVRAKTGVVTSSHNSHVWAEESSLDRGASAINRQEASGSQCRGIESAVKTTIHQRGVIQTLQGLRHYNTGSDSTERVHLELIVVRHSSLKHLHLHKFLHLKLSIIIITLRGSKRPQVTGASLNLKLKTKRGASI